MTEWKADSLICDITIYVDGNGAAAKYMAKSGAKKLLAGKVFDEYGKIVDALRHEKLIQGTR